MDSRRSLFLFSAVLLAALPAASGKSYISTNMDADIAALRVYFNISRDSSLFGNSVFLKYVAPKEAKLEDTEQWLLLREILDVYISILSKIKTHATSDVRNAVGRVLCRVEGLKSSYSHQEEGLLKRHLQDVWATKANDTTVQRKAVRELAMVFQKASEAAVKIHEKKSPRTRRSAGRFCEGGSS